MSDDKALGSAPIEPELKTLMNTVANALDDVFNGPLKGDGRATGWVLMVFPFHNATGRCNYISNANRQDIIALLTEQLAYFKGMPESGEPNAQGH